MPGFYPGCVCEQCLICQPVCVRQDRIRVLEENLGYYLAFIEGGELSIHPPIHLSTHPSSHCPVAAQVSDLLAHRSITLVEM